MPILNHLAKSIFKHSSQLMKTAMGKGARALGQGSRSLSNIIQRTSKSAADYAKQSGGWAETAENVAKQTLKSARRTPIGKLGAAGGKFAIHTGRGAAGVGKLILKHPTKVGISAGLIGGVTKYNVNRAQDVVQDYRRRKETGMKSNHLGTDGLTLSLSRTRHGNNVRKK